MEIEELIIELFNIGCVKFGEFTLKSGLKSPVYFDLRLLVSYPKLLILASNVICKKISQSLVEYDLLCGVPYGAISLATAISMQTNKSMIFKRKDAKSHGTKNLVEGIYNQDDKCLIVDDVITSGVSILETVQDLRNHGLQVNDAVVLLDREQGGPENLAKHNIKIHSVLKTSDVLNILFNSKKLSQEMYDKTNEFLNTNKTVIIPAVEEKQDLDFGSRAKLCSNKIAKKLFEIIELKQSNLCFSADFNSFDELIKYADQLGPYICMLKTHIDIINDFNMDKIQQLVDLSLKHNFLIFEDRKFADIGNTVKHQYSQGVYKISQWSNIINAHSIAGPGCIQGLKEADDYSNKACLLIAQLSSKENLIDQTYTQKTIKLAEEHNDFVIGFICQKKLSNNPTMVHMTPGIQFNDSQMKDTLGQQYTTPEMAILENKCDVIIVGRGILKSNDPVQTAIKYQKSAYESYLKRLNL